jgi:uncharacterized membrane protein YhiD involved in acid resistance
MSTVEMLLRLGAGIGLGTVIGLERQYRARMAGLRTNALLAPSHRARAGVGPSTGAKRSGPH